jgi:hypothetical protein
MSTRAAASDGCKDIAAITRADFVTAIVPGPPLTCASVRAPSANGVCIVDSPPPTRSQACGSPKPPALNGSPARPEVLEFLLRALAPTRPYHTGAELYILKQILHDWSDEQAQKILATCRRAMSPGSRLLVLEMLVEPDDNFPKRLDLMMMKSLPKRECGDPDKLS